MNKFKGHNFDTPAQVARAAELWGKQKDGSIDSLMFHPKIKITEVDLPYTVPFVYCENGFTVYEAFKGLVNPRFKDLVRLWPVYGAPFAVLRVTRSRRGQTVVVKEIGKGQ